MLLAQWALPSCNDFSLSVPPEQQPSQVFDRVEWEYIPLVANVFMLAHFSVVLRAEWPFLNVRRTVEFGQVYDAVEGISPIYQVTSPHDGLL